MALHARVVIDETGRRVNAPEHPQRLVSLAPSITETLYALGLGDRLVGDTDYCDYPPEAKLKPHVGNVLNPSLEKIVALKPDLVLGISEGNRIETADQLQRVGIPIYGLTDHTLDDTLRSIADLGRVLDADSAADALGRRLRARIAEVERRVAGAPRPKVLFVVWYQPLTTAGAHTFISDVIRRAGGVSISDRLPGDWPRLSLEAALDRNPDVILFPGGESMAPSLDDIRRLPGWRDLAAVKHDRLHVVSESIIHPSPRLVDALEQVAAVLHPDRMKGYTAGSADYRLPFAVCRKLSVVSCQLSVGVGLRMSGNGQLITDNGRLFQSAIGNLQSSILRSLSSNRQSAICNRQFFIEAAR
ncbi:MAG: ABC transporter substrate-binding protein [Terriglobia bacterium]